MTNETSPILQNQSKSIISSNYGVRTHPITGEVESFHKGVDFAVPIGTPIYALKSGTVTRSSYENGFGNRISIKYGDDKYEGFYAHLSEILVKEKAYVTAGQLIGYSGNTGQSSGPHLHYEEAYFIDNPEYIEGNGSREYLKQHRDPTPSINESMDWLKTPISNIKIIYESPIGLNLVELFRQNQELQNDISEGGASQAEIIYYDENQESESYDIFSQDSLVKLADSGLIATDAQYTDGDGNVTPKYYLDKDGNRVDANEVSFTTQGNNDESYVMVESDVSAPLSDGTTAPLSSIIEMGQIAQGSLGGSTSLNKEYKNKNFTNSWWIKNLQNSGNILDKNLQIH